MPKFYVVHFDVDSKTSVVDEKKVLSRQGSHCEVRWSKNATYLGRIVGDTGKVSNQSRTSSLRPLLRMLA